MTSGYQLRTLVGPAIEPVSLAEARKQCVVDEDITEDDELLEFLIGAAREMAEEFTRRSFVERTLELTLDAFPSSCYPPGDGRIQLPQGPVIDLVEVRYTDKDGATQYITDATLVRDDGGNYILPAYGQSGIWPTCRLYPGAVAVVYTAGYASSGSPVDAANVPKRAKQAIKMLVGHWYENRETIVIGQTPADVPFGFYEALQGLREYP